jgi:hypothetical protein
MDRILRREWIVNSRSMRNAREMAAVRARYFIAFTASSVVRTALARKP